MTEQVEFQVVEPGSPNLNAPVETPQAETVTQVVSQGWTPEEASSVVGGMVANLTIVMYAMKWRATPPMELMPVIAGDPKTEFPMLGISLAPILDILAPKGGAAAVGVSLSAGVGEIVGAVARRSQVLMTAPPQKQAPAPRPGPAPQPQAPVEESGSFKFSGDQLRVLQSPYEQLGFA